MFKQLFGDSYTSDQAADFFSGWMVGWVVSPNPFDFTPSCIDATQTDGINSTIDLWMNEYDKRTDEPFPYEGFQAIFFAYDDAVKKQCRDVDQVFQAYFKAIYWYAEWIEYNKDKSRSELSTWMTNYNDFDHELNGYGTQMKNAWFSGNTYYEAGLLYGQQIRELLDFEGRPPYMSSDESLEDSFGNVELLFMQ